MSVLEKLTEGIVNRDLQKEGAALLEKWEKTGLLEGVESDSHRNGMARLLENQAKELLREASSMAAGDVEGFAAVAFPLVRRVFGSLIANDLVSVQPMSLPSGLIFFLDFTYQGARLGIDQDDSVYGGGVVASQLTGGVTDLTGDGGGLYNLANAYSSPTGSVACTTAAAVDDDNPSSMDTTKIELNDGATSANVALGSNDGSTGQEGVALSTVLGSEAMMKSLRYDPDILTDSDQTKEVFTIQACVTDAVMSRINKHALHSIMPTNGNGVEQTHGLAAGSLVRRLTELGYRDSNGNIVANSKDNYISFYYFDDADTLDCASASTHITFADTDSFASSDNVGSVVGTEAWGLEEPKPQTGNSGVTDGNTKNAIPEIDIKVDSVSVTAITKKLKAKWSPELGQDLNAYHNLDAEVELTSILSEQIALEIDREILNDLVQGATAGTYYWSRSPGLFVNKTTGAELGAAAAAPDFTGTVSEWYETLVETINDVSAQIHRKTLRGGANFIVCGPEVANILEFTNGFRADVTGDADRGSVGAVKTGNLSKKWDVLVDPYFPRNVVLVGRKGGSFLESGYVYAPYVPLQVTPTIFGTEDFVPRKGVMTRYAKKMVRPDMYGLVVVRGLLGESGSS